MRLRTKLAALAITGAVAVTASAAFAFWSADGSGSGSGAVLGANQFAVEIVGVIDEALYPGGDSPVTFTITNQNPQAVAAGIISLDAVQATEAGCNVNAFTMANVDATAEMVPAKVGSVAGALILQAKGSLEMANLAQNQDACKGAGLTLTLSSTEQ